MNGKVITLSGEMGSGKGTYIKNTFLSRSTRKKFAYVRMLRDYSDDVKQFLNFDEFLEAVSYVTDAIIIIDEAFTILPETINQNKKRDQKLITFLVNSRKANNFVFIVYHMMSQVPTKWILGYSNYFIRFNTNDQLNYQLTRFSSYPNIVQSLKDFPKIAKMQYDEIKIR